MRDPTKGQMKYFTHYFVDPFKSIFTQILIYFENFIRAKNVNEKSLFKNHIFVEKNYHN